MFEKKTNEVELDPVSEKLFQEALKLNPGIDRAFFQEFRDMILANHQSFIEELQSNPENESSEDSSENYQQAA